MKNDNKKKIRCIEKLLLLLLSFIFLYSCAPPARTLITESIEDGHYDSEFPASRSSSALTKALESIRLLNSVAYYKAYNYPPGAISKIPAASHMELEADKILFFNNTASGTATFVYAFEKDIALLTCAHVITFPDTIITYYEKSKSIQSIAIKIRQHIYINELPDGDDIKIIAVDMQNDIAIVQRRLKEKPVFLQPVFPYPTGKSANLEWGAFVYLIGYPKGNKMVTHGLVSKLPGQRGSGDFLIDANFNRGFSGGMVLAIRDGIPNFELVGMAKSVSADYYYAITPGTPFNPQQIDSNFPYTGELYVEQRGEINYGITNAIAIETILKFIDLNRLRLMEAGLNPQLFFK